MTQDPTKIQKPLLGVSACLVGKPVRFDGGHKEDRFISRHLVKVAELKPICPEMGAGLGAPRPTIQLRQVDNQIRLVANKNPDQDFTDLLNNYSESALPALAELDGFIFKKNSPSCGVFRVPVVINQEGYREYDGQGLFAQAFSRRYPLIPVEEEGRLNDAGIRENFFERVYAYQRWKAIANADHNLQGFIEFHASHKLMLMARGSSYYQELGRMVAGVTPASLTTRRAAYIQRFSEVMQLRTARGRHVNVLQHIMGYLKEALGREDKQELLSVFEAYRNKELPLITAITLLQHHLRKHPRPYINAQHYLQPYPAQLALRASI